MALPTSWRRPVDKVPAVERLQTDGAYAGQCAGAIEQTHGIRVEREFQELLAFRSFCMTHVST
ncbi:hypothetical protein ABID77_004303 [Variovorax sp. PvP013]